MRNWNSFSNVGTSYALGFKGDQSCSDGDKIMTTQECRIACQTLFKEVGNDLRNGKACYVAGNQKCRQDGRFGPKASLVCKGTLCI